MDDAIAEQPWLPNGPIAVEVEWRLAGYERVRYPRSTTPGETVAHRGSSREVSSDHGGRRRQRAQRARCRGHPGQAGVEVTVLEAAEVPAGALAAAS